MKFIDYLKNKALNEMAVERKVAVSVCYSQFNSIITHLLKVYIGQDLKSALPGEEWERQINGFLNEILKHFLKRRIYELLFFNCMLFIHSKICD